MYSHLYNQYILNDNLQKFRNKQSICNGVIKRTVGVLRYLLNINPFIDLLVLLCNRYHLNIINSSSTKHPNITIHG